MTGQAIEEYDALLALLLTPGLGQPVINRGLSEHGSAQALLEAPAKEFARLAQASHHRGTKLRRAVDQTLEQDEVAAERDRMAEAGVHLVSIHDAAYPRLLRNIPDPPPALWVRGELREADALAVAMVGARKCTHYGREQADRLASQTAQAGLCVVSGGAHGIDRAAHQAALRLGGRTIAMLGSGLGNPYPQANRELFDHIAESGAGRGAVISELPMQAPARPGHFPRRNRIVSGLALGVVVVEASSRSGALITARLAVEEHGREVMAVPGRADSRASDGCHKMIQEGWARLVTGGADVLDGLGEAGQILKKEMAAATGAETEAGHDPGDDGSPARLSEPQQQIVAALDAPRTLDQVIAATGLPAQQVQTELTMLEVQGTIHRRSGLFEARRTGQR
jgi:DNA processing protein